MTKRDALRILRYLLQNLEDDKTLPDKAWLNGAISYFLDIFGESSHRYEEIKNIQPISVKTGYIRIVISGTYQDIRGDLIKIIEREL